MTTLLGVMRSAVIPLALAAALTLPYSTGVAAQGRQSLPVQLTDGPAKSGFDIGRFSNLGNGFFETFYVETTEPLQKVLADGRVVAETRLLVLETATGPIALLKDQMAFHHIAEGLAGDKDWMATF